MRGEKERGRERGDTYLINPPKSSQDMKHKSVEISLLTIVFSMLLISTSTADAELIPEWVKKTVLWYGQGLVSESEFINSIKFLIDEKIIVLYNEEDNTDMVKATIIIPNGNFDVSSKGFYLPLNLEAQTHTTVTWVNEDSVPHNIQSQDKFGKVSDVFNSPPLNTGERFEFAFEESGVYNYYCSFHPWRVGIVTIK